jgi:hypothetical protein
MDHLWLIPWVFWEREEDSREDMPVYILDFWKKEKWREDVRKLEMWKRKGFIYPFPASPKCTPRNITSLA